MLPLLLLLNVALAIDLTVPGAPPQPRALQYGRGDAWGLSLSAAAFAASSLLPLGPDERALLDPERFDSRTPDRSFGMGSLATRDTAGFGIDRQRLYRPSAAWGSYADGVLYGSLALVFVPMECPSCGGDASLRNLARSAIIAEAAMAAAASRNVLAGALHRRRPYAYLSRAAYLDTPAGNPNYDPRVTFTPCEPDPRGTDTQTVQRDWCLSDRDAFRSFPSGHTTTVAAAAFAWASTYSMSHQGDRVRFVATHVGAAVLTASVGIGQVQSKQNFVTDTLAGGLLGAAWGVLLPRRFFRPTDAKRIVQLSPVGRGIGLEVPL